MAMMLTLSPELAGHVAVAMLRHRRHSQGLGLREPEGFQELLELLTSRASEGQRGTPLDDLWEVSQSQVMTPLAVTYDQAGELLGCSTRQVKRLISQRAFPRIRVGGLARVRVSDLEAYLARHEEESA